MAAIVTTPTLPFDVGGGIEDAFSELNLFLLDQSCVGAASGHMMAPEKRVGLRMNQ